MLCIIRYALDLYCNTPYARCRVGKSFGIRYEKDYVRKDLGQPSCG